MSFIAGMARAYNDQREDVTRQLNEEQNQRDMARMRRIDREQVLDDRERDTNAGVLRNLPPQYGAVPDARDIPMNPDVATGAAPTGAAPRADRGRVTAPRSKPGIYDNPSLLGDQTEAETQRLARMRAPGNFNRMPGAEPVPLPNTPALIKQRADELRKRNPAGEGVGVNTLIGGSNTDADAIARLKATDAAIRGRPAFDAFKNAIFGQESGNGAVDTSQPNYAGALGKGQILESTFNGLKAAGKIPRNFDWRNPAHNEAASVAYMQEAWAAAKGDPQLAAAYYYGGPKAIQNGQIVTYRDTKNPNAPTTNQYAAQVMQRMGGPAAQAAPAAPVGTPSAAPQQQVPNRQFAPGQFFSSVPQVDEQARLAQFQMDQISQLVRNTRQPKDLAVLQQKYSELQQQVREADLYKLGARADTDVAALSQLVQLSGINIARTPQGFVEVDASGKATSALMSQSELAQKLFQFTSITARQQAAARSAKVFDARLKAGTEMAVEGVKNTGRLQNTELEIMGRVQQDLVKAGVDATKADVKFSPTGQVMVQMGRSVFEYVPGQETPFGATPGSFKPLGGLQ
jgi:hypothetical protein